jgi:hypothetical protein
LPYLIDYKSKNPLPTFLAGSGFEIVFGVFIYSFSTRQTQSSGPPPQWW